MNIKKIEIDNVELWEDNPRGIKKNDFERLKRQIKKLGLYKPLLAYYEQGKYIVLGGNMRLRAIRELGYNEVVVSVVEPKNNAEKLEYSLSDNDRVGYYEEDMLAELLHTNKTEINFDDYKIDLSKQTNIDDLVSRYAASDIKEDEPPPVPKKPKSKLGDLYILGEHRLLCGDCALKEDIDKLMDGHTADMVFTDPPYGVKYTGKTKDKLKISNDKNTKAFSKAIKNYRVKEGASFYVCCPAINNNFIDFSIAFSEICNQSSTIIWVKNNFVLGHGDYHYKHEPILYGWEKNGTHNFYGDRTQTTVWEIDRPSRSEEHPTMKPIALCVKAITNSSKQSQIVLDTFGGSGSTMMACEQTNRKCYMMEIDPAYCDVIVNRWENLTGKKAVKA